jgi:type I restriction enzyme, S subunit
LGEVGKTITGKTPSTKEDSFWGGEIPFITPTDINNDSRYCIPARTISEKGKESLKLR